MSEPPGAEAEQTPPAPPAPIQKRKRTTLSTGFSDVPGKTCQVCGYEGFRWQTTCPAGHPLA